MSESQDINRPMLQSDRGLRLVLTGSVWELILRQLSHGSTAGAYARLRLHGTPIAVEYLCDHVQLVDAPPTGSTLRPTEDWLFISFHRPGQASADSLRPHMLQPGSWQTMIWLELDRSRPGSWQSVVSRCGQQDTLTEILIIGPGLLRLVPTASGDHVSPAEDSGVYADRWSRTRGVVGDRVLQRLQSSRVMLVGAGRNGTLAAFQLASLGVGCLALMDADTLQIHNMDANPGVPLPGCGLPKVQALAEALRLFRPDLTVQLLQQHADYRTLETYLRERSDLVVTCVDSDTPRMGVSIVARRNLLLHLDIATSIQRLPTGELSLIGDASLLLPATGCCGCVGGFQNPAATRHDLTAPPNSLRRQMQPEWHQQRAGSLVTLNSIVVGAAVQTWLDLLTGVQTTSVWHRFRWRPGTGLQADSTPVQAGENCEICGMFRQAG